MTTGTTVKKTVKKRTVKAATKRPKTKSAKSQWDAIVAAAEAFEKTGHTLEIEKYKNF